MYPERLIPTRSKAELINPCSECYLCRRIKPINLFDSDGELNHSAIELAVDKNTLTSKYSSNYKSCDNPDHLISSELRDVLIKIDKEQKDLELTDWKPDIETPRAKDIKFSYYSEYQVYGVKFEKFNIRGVFPKNNHNKGKSYKIQPVYKPNLVNLFHFELEFYKEDEMINFNSMSTWKRFFILKLREIIGENILLFESEK